jgi:hypothetical protein
MLEREHINWYREDITRARVAADGRINDSFSRAKQALCAGCDYCRNVMKHKRVLDQTYEELLSLVSSLKEGDRPIKVFAKEMTHEHWIYRGFITDEGEYIPMHFKLDHSQYRKEYAQKYGEARAYRMINIHGRGMKTRILFCDRNSAPTDAQYVTLKELMIDAHGALSFDFEFDTNHPLPT